MEVFENLYPFAIFRAYETHLVRQAHYRPSHQLLLSILIDWQFE